MVTSGLKDITDRITNSVIARKKGKKMTVPDSWNPKGFPGDKVSRHHF